jgi:hypothetical protein
LARGLGIYTTTTLLLPDSSRFFIAFDPIFDAWATPSFSKDRAMAFAADFEILFDRLGDELRHAPSPEFDLFAKVIASACTRILVAGKAGRATRIGKLIDAGAWTEAALAMIELELPAWKLRRVVYENSEWLCSLTRQPNLPVGFDESVDAAHAVLPLAILQVFIEARRVSNDDDAARSLVPRVRPADGSMICCDNFA